MSAIVDRAEKWFDFGYKGAVILGSLALVWANATFARRSDMEDINKTLYEIKASLTIYSKAIDENTNRFRDLEGRIRILERLPPAVK